MAVLNPNAAAAVRQALTDTEARDNLRNRGAVGPISRSAADLLWAEPQPRDADTRDPLPPVIPVDLASARPGDIAVFADHTAIVAGNGRLIGPAGQQHPTGPGFQGIFRPAQTVNKDANTNELKGVGEV
ncbi:hypothetical protein MA6G0728R_5355 [Mycobacteroides abscessus 6G-0728-R]|nr:hypothetical protein MA6G0125S_5407 [Mycobacteroides abscessus 6G-0125-S]EIU64210.1 hypothetical protein MA6G0728S_5327 [Mycobacteroides abscessus 6G-0728-S]EIU74762.1 hypothetical protein MA6G1108_5410 [Mycobacteroides abscessus 6G-1108]EIV03075.1 hypothetical protein MA6G0728R_5355 [Mycobacteroides abscessus 6G-0728-R]